MTEQVSYKGIANTHSGAKITWRLAVGGLGAFNSGDASMFLQLPQWWGYAAAFVACLFWTLACLYSVLRSVGDMRGAANGEGA